MLYYIRNLIILTLMKNDIHCSGTCSCRFSWFPIIPWASHNMILIWPWFSRSHAVCMLTARAGLISLNRRFSTDYFMSELSLTLDPGREGLMESSVLISSEALEGQCHILECPKGHLSHQMEGISLSDTPPPTDEPLLPHSSYWVLTLLFWKLDEN